MRIFCLLALLIAFVTMVTEASKPRQGKFTFTLSNELQLPCINGLYLNSTIHLTIKPIKANCTAKGEQDVCWTIRGGECLGDYQTLATESSQLLNKSPWQGFDEFHRGQYLSNCANQGGAYNPIKASCSSNFAQVKYLGYNRWHNTTAAKEPEEPQKAETKRDVESAAGDVGDVGKTGTSKIEEKDGGESMKKTVAVVTTPKSTEAPTESLQPETKPSNAVSKNMIAKVPFEAIYAASVWMSPENDATYEVTLEMKNPFGGYLSANDYPLLTFYMLMCILYAFYAFVWLMMSACHYRDLLRVQFWIGGVILLGMIEKAVFYAEYKNVDDTGISVLGAAKFAEVVSSLKRSLARMLVIIVSLGFGIVKPRLGPMLHRVIAIGVLYFTLAVVDAFSKHQQHEGINASLYTFIPLAVVDSIICWWIFVSLLQTMKTLRLRRNVVKLSLYRKFFNTIIVTVLMSMVLVFWSIHVRSQGASVCRWQELWIESALWHLLFSLILLVIMILWRPNANNQIYAYSPMIDGNMSDDEDGAEEPMLSGNGLTESMKLRSVGKDGNSHSQAVDPNEQTEADLKWIDENIPQTMADNALPILIDSDEDEHDTKFEMSKID